MKKISLTDNQLNLLIEAVEYTKDQVGERYRWPNDPDIKREKAALARVAQRLIKARGFE